MHKKAKPFKNSFLNLVDIKVVAIVFFPLFLTFRTLLYIVSVTFLAKFYFPVWEIVVVVLVNYDCLPIKGFLLSI